MSDVAQARHVIDHWDTAAKIGDDEWELDGHEFTRQEALDKVARLRSIVPTMDHRPVHVTGHIQFTEEAP